MRSTERTGEEEEEEEEDEDKELIWKENGGTRVLYEIFSTLDDIACISSFKNLRSIIKLEFLKLERLVFQFVLQYDNYL